MYVTSLKNLHYLLHKERDFCICRLALLWILQFKEFWKCFHSACQPISSESSYLVLLVAQKSETVTAKQPKSN